MTKAKITRSSAQYHSAKVSPSTLIYYYFVFLSIKVLLFSFLPIAYVKLIIKKCSKGIIFETTGQRVIYVNKSILLLSCNCDTSLFMLLFRYKYVKI